ncbi:uroporphyrinogen-III C-methyltransferase [Marinomonas algicola]|uniref:uroporphyrinogen-III C-methyltransferase n=1 Tax=Marinomonas algicola TaxID=2773454 RepID=UPI001749601E|nr:uroporphyrinogen-III C-methyltransferase [Marinomonas algicola]
MTENASNKTASDTDQLIENKGQMIAESEKDNKNKLSLVAIAIGVVAIGMSGWSIYQQQVTVKTIQPISQQVSQLSRTQNNLDQKVTQQNTLAQSLPSMEKRVAQQDKEIKKIIENINGAQAQVSQQNNKLASFGQQLHRIGNTTKEDWKLAESEYLIRLANQRLLMESDITGAESLLSSADQILGEMADPILFETRKAIAKDIQSLKATTAFDTEGLYLQLDALATQIEQLPQREPSKEWMKNNASNDAANNSDQEERTLQSTWTELWASVKSLIVINYNHKPIKALLPAADYQELVSSIQVQISVAQLALLKKQRTVYQTSLNHVVEAVSTHFDLKAKPVVAFMTSITALQQINPQPELPLPRDSLTAIKKLMKEWQSIGDNNQSIKVEEHKEQTSTYTRENTPPVEPINSTSDNATIEDSATEPNTTEPVEEKHQQPPTESTEKALEISPEEVSA